MSKRIFTNEQIAQLVKNEHVSRCTERSITWSKEFKLKAVTSYEQGLSSAEIFLEAGFDLGIIGRDQPRECLKRWNRLYRKKGEDWFRNENRGQLGRPRKIKDESDAQKIKRLEDEIAYLKAENNFLTKLRKKSLNYDHAKSIKSLNH